MLTKRFYTFTLLAVLFSSLSFSRASGLGVLTHEAIVDAAWDKSILPLLQQRYASATPEELKIAHAYAYGGAVVPDMGYYPFGSHLFTNLVHYVRSGDMVESLLKNAADVNQYAFALGFLSHYYADNHGHALATNVSVPLLYQELKQKFGDTVTYADDPVSHIRMEFGFDVLQIAKGNYASDAYHDLIGFMVDTAVLRKAFNETYGLNINHVFSNHLHLTVELFRFMVASVLPEITRAGWASKRADILKKDNSATSKSFRYKMRIRQYNKQFGKDYMHRGVFPYILSFVIRVMPKVGPLRVLNFKIPDEEVEKKFVEGFDSILFDYQKNIHKLMTSPIVLKDGNCDTGEPSQHCAYRLADDCYNKWLLQLRKNNFTTATPRIVSDISSFYHDFATEERQQCSRACRKVASALRELRSVKTE